MSESDPFRLAADFPPATREQWQKLVDIVLKGAPHERLTHTTYDGIKIEPLPPRQADAQPVAGRAPGKPWQVMARIENPDPGAANAEALHELENGASGLSLVFAGAVGAHGFGLPAGEDAMARALDGVRLDAGIALDIDLTPFARELPQQLAALVKRRGLNPAATTIRFGYDPLNAIAATGRSPLPWNQTAPLMSRLIGALADAGFNGPFAAADGRIIHHAGGSEAQELAFALASATDYLRALEASGVALDTARRMICFRLTADAEQFLTMAKFRALRKLWARVEQACGVAPAPAFVSAETAWRTMTRRDPHMNMLRTTIAVVAAGLGGADAMSAIAFTAAIGLPDRFARRIARNTQLILLEESNLAKVGDSAAGSGAIELLTQELCRVAWDHFQEIERAGGVAAALESGLIQSNVAAVRSKREAAIAQRRDVLVGTSDYPDLAELPATVLDAARVAVPPIAGGITFPALAPIRLSVPFEALRDTSDRMLASTGARPNVFLANLGTPSDFTARATFAKNFYEAGGIEAVTNDGFKSPADMIAAFGLSGSRLACLCASDKVYEAEAIAAAQALRAAGALHVYLAGRPGEREATYRNAGVGTFIYNGCDVLAVLEAAHGLIVR
jgi:methylmalonyl-CoA mutase